MSIVSAASSAPLTSASVSRPPDPARVKTARSWSGSAWRSRSVTPPPKAASRASRRPASLPSETLGTASREAIHCRLGQGSDHELAAVDDRLAVDLDGRLEQHAVEVHGNLNGAADRRRSAKGDVSGAEDLLVLEDVAGQHCLLVGADAELGDIGPVLAVNGQQVYHRGAVGTGRLDQVTLAHGQRDRRLQQPDAGDRAVNDQGPLPGALQRRDEALAAGQVAEGAAVAEFAGVDDPQPPIHPKPEVAAVPAADPHLRAGVEGGDDRPAAPAA